MAKITPYAKSILVLAITATTTLLLFTLINMD